MKFRERIVLKKFIRCYDWHNHDVKTLARTSFHGNLTLKHNILQNIYLDNFKGSGKQRRKMCGLG